MSDIVSNSSTRALKINANLPKLTTLVTASAAGKFMSMVSAVMTVPHCSQLWSAVSSVLLVTSVAAGANCGGYHHTASDGAH